MKSEVNMRPLILSLALLLTLLFVTNEHSSQTPVLTKEDAAALVISEFLGGHADSVFLYVTYEMVSQGEEVNDLRGTVFTVPSQGWVSFIDDHPTANWEHPCRYVFIDSGTGNYEVYDRVAPPPSWGVNYWPYPTEAFIRLGEAELIEVEPPTPPSNMRYAPGNKYAVIINGGIDKWSNYLRYWNDVQFIYTTLTGVYDWREENVFVLFSDGLSDTFDLFVGGDSLWADSKKDLDGDGIRDFDGPATLECVDAVFTFLASKVRLNDRLLVYMTDHGGSWGGWNAFAYLWNGDILTDSHLQDLLLGLTQCQIMTVLEPCYSGGFMDELGTNEEGGMGRGFTSACEYNELSWAFFDYQYDVFVYFWTSAMSQLNPLGIGDPSLADLDMDNMISFYEAFLYAELMDREYLDRLEHPQYTDDPDGIGQSWFLGNRFWGPPIAAPFDDLFGQAIVGPDHRR